MTTEPPGLEDAPVPAAVAEQEAPSSYVDLYNPRERVRTLIALGLLAVVVLLTLGSAAAVFAGAISDVVFKDVLAGLLAPILGVFGTVTGFYYGTHASEQRGR